LYDDVFLRVWIGDETLTWVHKHYVISRMGTSAGGGRSSSPLGNGELFIERNSEGSSSERSLGQERVCGRAEESGSLK
jgi:hypothetical protein